MKTPPISEGGAGETPALPKDAPEMGANEDCISLNSLAMPDGDNGDQMANPEVGDRVQYQVEGTVTRIEGENAYIKRESINGEPVDDKADDEGAEPTPDDERAELGGMAGQMGGM